MTHVPDQDSDLEWFIHEGASAMRETGTLAATVNQLESGGHGGGKLDAAGSYIHPLTDQQLGTGRCLLGDVERHRWLSRAWFACSEEARGKLLLRHQAPRGAFRSDSGYAATDRYVEGSDHREGRLGLRRTGVETHLGVLAALALQLAHDPKALLEACHDPDPLHSTGKHSGKINREESKRRRRLIRDAKEGAEAAMLPAWEEWHGAKTAADPMRSNLARNPNWKVQTPMVIHVTEGTNPESIRQAVRQVFAQLRDMELAP